VVSRRACRKSGLFNASRQFIMSPGGLQETWADRKYLMISPPSAIFHIGCCTPYPQGIKATRITGNMRKRRVHIRKGKVSTLAQLDGTNSGNVSGLELMELRVYV